ncbi:MAG: RIP metalloprotease RseP [Candidatus Magasanikbacteria bacterium]|nr:RIP metalloprotease RseP [Candidatus Magasanikbacteria bacterium]
MVTLLIFIAVLAVLVISHEWGHFVAARKSGMKVYEFGFGFPPRLFGIQMVKDEAGTKKWRFIWGRKPDEETAGGTVYSFNLLPLGGFVRIKGEDGQDQGPDSFSAQKAWKKAITLMAGVGMNIILAFILLSVGFMIGAPQALNNLPPGTRVENSHLEIMEAAADKPAGKAGLQTGDIIVALDDVQNPTVKAMQEYVDSHKDQDIKVLIKRGDETLEKNIRPFVYADTGKGGLGVSLIEVGLVRYPWYKSLYYGLIMTGLYLKEILFSFYYLISGLIAGAPVGESLSGPVGIAVMTGKVAKLGFNYLLNFMALLSLNLAILNVLPIPALDGGRLLFLIISKIKGKAVQQKYEQIAHGVGFILLISLVVLITIKDLGKFKGLFMGLIQKVIGS